MLIFQASLSIFTDFWNWQIETDQNQSEQFIVSRVWSKLLLQLIWIFGRSENFIFSEFSGSPRIPYFSELLLQKFIWIVGRSDNVIFSELLQTSKLMDKHKRSESLKINRSRSSKRS